MFNPIVLYGNKLLQNCQFSVCNYISHQEDVIDIALPALYNVESHILHTAIFETCANFNVVIFFTQNTSLSTPTNS